MIKETLNRLLRVFKHSKINWKFTFIFGASIIFGILGIVVATLMSVTMILSISGQVKELIYLPWAFIVVNIVLLWLFVGSPKVLQRAGGPDTAFKAICILYIISGFLMIVFAFIYPAYANLETPNAAHSIPLWVTAISLVGSVLSFLAASILVVLATIKGREERHLRTPNSIEVTKIGEVVRESPIMANTNELIDVTLRDIKEGEGQRIEFKKSFAEEDEAIRSLCAFTNAQGGTVYFGIDQTKGVLGVTLGQNTLENFANKIHKNTEPPINPIIDSLICLGSNIVAVRISKVDSGQLFFAFGDALIRVGKTNQKMSPAAIKERLSKGQANSNGTRYRAKLTARIEERSQGNFRLVIENTGDGEARNIRLVMDGKPFESHPTAVMGDNQFNFIGPHSQVTRLLAITFGCTPPFEFEVYWQDDSGQEGQYRTMLTF